MVVPPPPPPTLPPSPVLIQAGGAPSKGALPSTRPAAGRCLQRRTPPTPPHPTPPHPTPPVLQQVVRPQRCTPPTCPTQQVMSPKSRTHSSCNKGRLQRYTASARFAAGRHPQGCTPHIRSAADWRLQRCTPFSQPAVGRRTPTYDFIQSATRWTPLQKNSPPFPSSQSADGAAEPTFAPTIPTNSAGTDWTPETLAEAHSVPFFACSFFLGKFLEMDGRGRAPSLPLRAESQGAERTEARKHRSAITQHLLTTVGGEKKTITPEKRLRHGRLCRFSLKKRVWASLCPCVCALLMAVNVS
jgi:hypothetical protein